VELAFRRSTNAVREHAHAWLGKTPGKQQSFTDDMPISRY
jgi:hypothetical protein